MMNTTSHPITDKVGQIEHQTVHTTQGSVIDPDENRIEVVESTGLAVSSDDERKIAEYIKNAISVDNFVETFNDNAHETLIKLLALQNNKHPLKKGGIGIAYRTDALIMHCKMEFSAEENVVFDAILGTMSSFPEDKTYRIEPASFLKYSRYQNPKTLYNVFKKGSKKLSDRTLVFQDLGENGEDSIKIPWFNILRYHQGKGNSGEITAYIEFAPSDFFKDLALCSQLVHGAYGALEVTTQLVGKYTIALYWYLENRKNYKEYPNATPGVFRITTEELREQFSIPDSYTTTDIKRRVFEPAKNSINEVEECDFTFDYEELKAEGKVAGYLITIKQKRYITAPDHPMIEENDVLYNQIKTFLEAYYIEMTEEEVNQVYLQAKRLNRDGMFMNQAIMFFKKRLDDNTLEPIDNKVAYLYKMVEMGNSTPTLSNKQNNFNRFTQNDYNYSEEDLLDN